MKMVMSKGFSVRILACMLCLLPFIGEAQSPSTWITPQLRELNFPADTYIWGFVPGNLRSGETESDLLARLKIAACNPDRAMRTNNPLHW